MKKLFAVLCVLCIILGAAVADKYLAAPAQSAAKYINNRMVVLDAGHGGIDGGTVGITTGMPEADINLDVTLKTAELLSNAGISVVLTRTKKASLCSDEHYSKKLDMQLRGEIIAAARPDIVVSIHMNSYPSPTVKGAQVFFCPGSTEGEKLAQCLQTALLYVDPDNKRQIKQEDFFLLRTYAGPSALVECGFMSCPEEERKLVTESYRADLAYCIFCGITEYLAKLP